MIISIEKNKRYTVLCAAANLGELKIYTKILNQSNRLNSGNKILPIYKRKSSIIRLIKFSLKSKERIVKCVW